MNINKTFIKLKETFNSLMRKKEDNIIENKKWVDIKNKNIKKID